MQLLMLLQRSYLISLPLLLDMKHAFHFIHYFIKYSV